MSHLRLEALPDRLSRLGGYQWPAAPATATAKAWATRLLVHLKLADSGPEEGIAAEKLLRLEEQHITAVDFDALFRVYLDLLDNTYLEWARGRSDGVRHCALLQMPDVPADLIGRWVRQHNFQPIEAGALCAPALSGETQALLKDTSTTLVVENLSGQWLRTMGGLDGIDRMLQRVESSPARMLFCFSSWSWRYLASARSLELVFCDRRCFPAFGAEALAALMMRRRKERDLKRPMRSIESGKNVLALDDDDALEDPYLKTLAARSLGCPWTALYRLNGLIRREPELDMDDGNQVQKATDTRAAEPSLWLHPFDERGLPSSEKLNSALMLHAVMVHDGIAEEDLPRVLPEPIPPGLCDALICARLLQRRGGRLCAHEGAAPDIRRVLDEQGFQLDML